MDIKPVVTRYGVLDCQVCVPKEWTDEQVVEFANALNSPGTDTWHIRKQGDPALKGDSERVQCAERPGFVHIMLDA